MTPTGVLLVTPIFRRGSGSLSLLQGPSRVALALHKARCGTPLGVTIRCNNKLTDEQFICLSPWVRFPCPLRVCGQQRRGASGCQRQCCAALALAVHGMQGASCPEALTCHVEFFSPCRDPPFAPFFKFSPLLPQGVCHTWPCAVPGQHVKGPGASSRNRFPDEK